MTDVLSNESFEELVERAIYDLPERFKAQLENVDFTIDTKTVWQSAGLYVGRPFTGPSVITIFKKQIDDGRTSDQIRDRITEVVRHEIAHHFGMTDADINREMK